MTIQPFLLNNIALPDVPGYTFRPLRYDDLPALHALLLTSLEADDEDRVDALADLRTQFDDPWSNPETDSLTAWTPAGQLVASVRCFAPPAPEREARCFMWPYLHPEHRAEALENALFDWLEARGLERLRAMPERFERSLRTGYRDTLTRYLALLEGRGFKPIRYFYRMRRDLSQPIPDGRAPDGVALRRYTPDDSAAMFHVFNESFKDHWGYEPVTPEEWEQFFVKRQSFRPDLSLVATAGGEVVGISFNTVSAEDNALTGLNEGWVGELGVLRPWRKRGVASALLCESMRLFRAEGLSIATLGVDSANPTGALRLYEGLGFKQARRFILMDKPLAG
jgi:ribosomal protein S18 acetylase RimI-like enzyme